MKEITDSQLGESLFTATLPSGLPVYVLPRRGMARKYATFATHYGSIDSAFVVPGATEPTHVPDGIAHFLEHKLFEEPDGTDVFARFSRLGATCNAYTYYTTTTYLFSTVDNFLDCVDVLVDFVQTPYLTDENVAKEQGIIEQELRMYQDMPSWRLNANLLENLYHHHPVRIEIGGTVESIRQIDKETLELCHRTFYHPSNMVFFAVGDIDPAETIERVGAAVAKLGLGPQPDIERLYPDEPPTVRQQWVEQPMAVAAPLLRLGYKETRLGLYGDDLLRQSLLSELVLAATVGPGSELYEELYAEGLIDDSFGSAYQGQPGFGHAIIGGQTPDPERLAARLRKTLTQFAEHGLPAEAFDRIRRVMAGRYVGLFDSPDSLAFLVNSLHFSGVGLFRYPDILASLDNAAANVRLRELFDPERSVVSVVKPK